MGANETGRRHDERLPGIFPVEFEVRGRPGTGVAIDLSPSGLRLRTNHEVSDGQTLHLSLTGPEGSHAELEADVRWVIEFPPFLNPTFAFEVGLHTDHPSESFLGLFDREVEKFLDYRDAPRVPNLVRVEVSGPGVWETTFALNISRRGMYVRTDRPLEPGQYVEVRVLLPREADPIPIRMEVVHSLDRARAEEMGTLPGVGLRVTPLPQDLKDRYFGFCEYLENRFLNQ